MTINPRLTLALAAGAALCGCVANQGHQPGMSNLGYSTAAKTASELNANAPEYWVGHRVYLERRMTWGYVKRPDATWKESRLVIFDESRKPAPWRSMAGRDADDHHEYKLQGRFAERKAYEPVINRLLDVFVLEGYESLGPQPPIPVRSPPVAIAYHAASAGPGRQNEERARKSATYENIE